MGVFTPPAYTDGVSYFIRGSCGVEWSLDIPSQPKDFTAVAQFQTFRKNMTQYLLLIHGNARSASSEEEWNTFFKVGRESGLFKGGSGIEDARIIIGDTSAKPSHEIIGYMRFDSEDKQKILDLLQQHPIVVHGGSVELCEMVRE
jgi:hypothetical protein